MECERWLFFEFSGFTRNGHRDGHASVLAARGPQIAENTVRRHLPEMGG